MPLVAGSIVELSPAKAVVGGRMLARVDGEVVLIAGTIPGERVTARIEKRQQGVWFATTVDVVETSPDRCDPGPDPACGGMTFAHIAYPRQCQLKVAMLEDAMGRIGRIEVPAAVPLTPSPTTGYRSRYRVHAGGGQLGFYREGTHDLCDPSASGQLAPESIACLRVLGERLAGLPLGAVEALELLENLPNTERVVNLAMREPRPPAPEWLEAAAGAAGVTGVSWTMPGRRGVEAAAGRPWVSDPVGAFTGAETATAPLRRHGPAFFQANRFLAPVLVRLVSALVTDGPVVDLYAGVGLFGVCLAAGGRRDITAIESDPISGGDLVANARPFGGALRVERTRVEEFLARRPPRRDSTLIVDPPRTGMSRAVVRALCGAQPARLVYVSCDLATLARDTGRLLANGYALTHLEALDLFPNTPHVEGVAVFDR